MSFAQEERFKRECRSLGMITVGIILFAIGINWFINPSGLYVGGVTGISQIISRLLYSTWGIKINLGLLIWSINIPLLLISYKFIGKRFTYQQHKSFPRQQYLIKYHQKKKSQESHLN